MSDLHSNLSVKQDVSETNINETDLSECEVSEVTENKSEYLPVPENVNPLPSKICGIAKTLVKSA